MKIKTYLVASLSEAVEQIKKELGPEAVILSTRKQPGSESWWNRSTAKLEVTAAIDPPEGPNTVSTSKPSSPSMDQTLKLITRVIEEKLFPLREELRRVVETSSHTQFPSKPRQESPEQKREDPPSEGVIAVPDPIFKVCQDLIAHRLRTKTVQNLSKDLIESGEDLSTLPETREAAAVWFMKNLPACRPYSDLPDPPRIIALVGPTGSGKTTTLVKLAVQLALKNAARAAANQKKKTFAFLTLDHYRVGAEEQLKKYASILKVPCELATNSLEFESALKRFEEVDTIFLDTTGSSPNDHEEILEIERSFHGTQPIWKALVLPTAFPEPELTRTLSQFRTLGCQSLILTKLDEAMAFGNLFNAPAISGLPLSYLTTGQRVPEDMEEAKKERIVDCLLNFSGQFGEVHRKLKEYEMESRQ